jgi:hypothetical protein
MKKNLTMLITALIMLNVSQAQEPPHRYIPNTSYEKDRTTKPKMNSADYYLEKSTKMQSNAWKLAGLGGVLGITGLLLYSAKDNSTNQMGASIAYAGGGELLMFSGAFLVVTSIPVYLESVHYKNKGLAMTASLNMEPIRDLNQSGLLVKYYPALALHVHL